MNAPLNEMPPHVNLTLQLRVDFRQRPCLI